MSLRRILTAATLLTLLSGCATHWVVDSDVRSFSNLPAADVAAGATYRFERLPSQQAASPWRDPWRTRGEEAVPAEPEPAADLDATLF